MAQSQMELAKAEQGKAQAQMLSAQAKAQADQAKNELTLQKQTYESQIAALKQELDEVKVIADGLGKTEELKLRKYDIDQRTALELVRIEAAEKTEENENFNENKQDVSQ